MKTNVSPTSLSAYFECLEGLNKQARELYNILSAHPDVTGNELSVFIENEFPAHHRHNVIARLSDLRTLGLSYVSGKRPCKITGKTVQTWRITPSSEFTTITVNSLEKALNNAKKTVAHLERKLSLAQQRAQ